MTPSGLEPSAAPLEDPGEALVEVRRQKAEALRARGQNPFANDQGRPTALGDIRRECTGPAGPLSNDELTALPEPRDRRVAGRVVAMRRMGKASFVRLRDRTGELQLFCRKDALGDEGYAVLDTLDLGDFVVSDGRPMLTKTGELSIEARSIRLLTKAFRPPPEKWHGLSDVETRYRQRYVDLIANPEVAEVFRARAAILRIVRGFFDARGFVEVETPMLHTLIGGAAARPFTTHHNALDLSLYLRIAPELYLKRCVVGGLERVYDLGRCYRNEGISTRHNPEFTMLEYYEAYATYDTLMTQTEEMLRFVDAELARAMPDAHARWREARSFALPDDPWPRLPMREAVAAALERMDRDPDRKARVDHKNLEKALAKCDTEGERVFARYEYLVEPFLAEDFRTPDGSRSVPVFVVDHPVETSPLARKKDADPTLVDRFELFVHGRELCNAFSELNDPDDQAARFRDQVARRVRGDEETMDFDADYVRALEHGLPPTAGFGMGIDRLVMILCAQASIRDVILFPLLRPET
ncbi:MAG: lysine--tRNA ligase [Deltaproteobacteria bacterium]|nr:lysine--tRNA ligase [Deltaproteobacteria bacterium]